MFYCKKAPYVEQRDCRGSPRVANKPSIIAGQLTQPKIELENRRGEMNSPGKSLAFKLIAQDVLILILSGDAVSRNPLITVISVVWDTLLGLGSRALFTGVCPNSLNNSPCETLAR